MSEEYKKGILKIGIRFENIRIYTEFAKGMRAVVVCIAVAVHSHMYLIQW